jgi:hypothetical protein
LITRFGVAAVLWLTALLLPGIASAELRRVDLKILGMD